MKNFIGIVIVIVAVVLVTGLFVDFVVPTYGFFAKVDSGNVGIVTHFGKIQDRVLPAGFHLTGYFEAVHPISIRTQIKKSEIVAFSSDIQQVVMQLSINYNITPDIANRLYTNIGDRYEEILMMPRLNENSKVVVSNYTAEKLVANREILSGEILELMQNDLAEYGITVSSVSIENIDFTDAFEAAVEAKQVATQEKQQAQTRQEQATMEATQAAERERIAAEAEANKMRINAEAEAYSVRIKAEAEAEANKMISASITKDLVDYTQAKVWDGELPNTYVGSDNAVPIIQNGGDE